MSAATERVEEYLRQRANQQRNFTGPVIHEVFTDPAASSAPLLLADVQQLLDVAKMTETLMEGSQ